MAESSRCTCPVLPVANCEAPPPSQRSLSSSVIMLTCQCTLYLSMLAHTLHPDTPSLTSAIVCLPGTVGSRKEIHIGVEEYRRGRGEESNPPDFRDRVSRAEIPFVNNLQNSQTELLMTWQSEATPASVSHSDYGYANSPKNRQVWESVVAKILTKTL
ncbi:hypothetical protein QQF64_021283 [Cirrhinus molitorella]|uniref:Uncharacterized protein n=1 Tax=Cirrhinus molitorella TaxID=172907 RepID=A0ABR3LFH6_9TELE